MGTGLGCGFMTGSVVWGKGDSGPGNSGSGIGDGKMASVGEVGNEAGVNEGWRGDGASWGDE